MNKVQELLGNGPKTGTIISKEDVEDYEKRGYNLSGLGYKTATGSFITTVGETEFRNNMINQGTNIAT
jgi:hypothetical protein